MYLDANNLYEWELSQLLPTSNFKWLTDEEMKDLDMMMRPDDSSKGYILECDLGKYYFYFFSKYVYVIKCNVSFLCISENPHDFIKCNVLFLCIAEYPHEIHDLHKDYLLVTERLQIEEKIFSNYQRHLLQDEGFSKPPSKLVPNLRNKTNYIIHYPNLNLYMELGLRLTNAHFDVSFDQLPWLKNCIIFNTRQRTAMKNGFEKYFLKMMNNTVYDHLLLCTELLLYFVHCRKNNGNSRNRHTVDLVTSEEKLKNFAAQLSFNQFKIFQEKLVAVDRAKFELTLNQPIYVRFAILDLFKSSMCDFHYN